MSEDQNTFDIQQSNVQILPNAKYAIQNFYGAEYARKVLSNRPCNKEAIAETSILDMFYYSDTKPMSSLQRNHSQGDTCFVRKAFGRR